MTTDPDLDDDTQTLTGHGGVHAVAAAQAHGVRTMFTLSGAHVFPLYDAAVGGRAGLCGGRRRRARRRADAAVAADRRTARGDGRLRRGGDRAATPGLAVVTAGPGVTNVVSPVTSASFNAAPVVVIGGRAPDFRAGTGALQEAPPAAAAPVTKASSTVHDAEQIGARTSAASNFATTAHRGPASSHVPMDALYSHGAGAVPRPPRPSPRARPRRLRCRSGAAARRRPPGGRDLQRRVGAAPRRARCPPLRRDDRAAGHHHGHGPRRAPGRAPMLVTRARSAAFAQADLVNAVGAPLDFRLGYGVFGGKDGATPARVVHLVHHPSQVAGHAAAALAASAAGDLTLVLLPYGVVAAWEEQVRHPSFADWVARLRDVDASARAGDAADLASDRDPIHPARIYGGRRRG